MCACGESEASSWNPSTNSPPGMGHCTNAAYAGDCRVPCAPGTLTNNTITVFDPEVISSSSGEGPDWYYDFSRPCIFYVGAGDSGDALTDETLWFWDANANRGPNGEACSALEGTGHNTGNLPYPPDPTYAQGGTNGGGASNEPMNWRGCWTPLITDAGGTCNGIAQSSPDVPDSGADYDEVDTSGGCWWTPMGETGGSGNDITYTVGTDTLPALWAGLFSNGRTINKPDWGAQCFLDYPPASATPTRYSCSADSDTGTAGIQPFCDGVNRALLWKAGGSFHTPGLFWPEPTSGTNSTDLARIASIPVGVYIFDTGTNFSPSGSGADFNANIFPVPLTGTLSYPADFPPDGDERPVGIAGYPMMTMVWSGQTPDTQNSWWVGIGQGWANPGSTTPPFDDPTAGANFASLIVENGNMQMRGNGVAAIAGSVFVNNGNLQWNGSGQIMLFGELRIINGNWELGGSGNYEWFYQDSLQQAGPGAPGIVTPPPINMRIRR